MPPSTYSLIFEPVCMCIYNVIMCILSLLKNHIIIKIYIFDTLFQVCIVQQTL